VRGASLIPRRRRRRRGGGWIVECLAPQLTTSSGNSKRNAGPRSSEQIEGLRVSRNVSFTFSCAVMERMFRAAHAWWDGTRHCRSIYGYSKSESSVVVCVLAKASLKQPNQYWNKNQSNLAKSGIAESSFLFARWQQQFAMFWLGVRPASLSFSWVVRDSHLTQCVVRPHICTRQAGCANVTDDRQTDRPRYG